MIGYNLFDNGCLCHNCKFLFKITKPDTIYGAFYPLSGSGNYVNQEFETYSTESVTSTVYVTQSGGPVPFRFAQRGSFNLRAQDSQNSHKTFIGEQKT